MHPNTLKELFESLALLSVPLERTFHLALVEVKNDKNISEKYKEQLLKSVKDLLNNSLELHGYVSNKNSNFDIKSDGITEYNRLRKEYKTAFSRLNDETINLHEHIEKLTS